MKKTLTVVEGFRAGILALHSHDHRLDIDEQLRLFRPGDLVDPINEEWGIPFKLLKTICSPQHIYDRGGFTRAEQDALKEAKVKRWIVVNVQWDDHSSYLWIEIISLGGHFRGWLRDPVSYLKMAVPSEEED